METQGSPVSWLCELPEMARVILAERRRVDAVRYEYAESSCLVLAASLIEWHYACTVRVLNHPNVER